MAKAQEKPIEELINIFGRICKILTWKKNGLTSWQNFITKPAKGQMP